MGLTEKGGVLITKVEPASFADDVGLQPNDVITAVNRQPVASYDDLTRIQGALRPGDAVVFSVLRPGGILERGSNRSPQWNSFYLSGTLPNKE